MNGTLFVPAYQRGYRWGADAVGRLHAGARYGAGHEAEADLCEKRIDGGHGNSARTEAGSFSNRLLIWSIKAFVIGGSIGIVIRNLRRL